MRIGTVINVVRNVYPHKRPLFKDFIISPGRSDGVLTIVKQRWNHDDRLRILCASSSPIKVE